MTEIATLGDILDALPPPPEVIRNLPSDLYHARPEISASQLKEFARSPRHFWYRYLSGQYEEVGSDALLFGRFFHALVLPGEDWRKEFVLAPEGIDRRTKEGKAAWADIEREALEGGKAIVKEEWHRQALAMAQSVTSHPAAKRLLSMDGEAEVSAFWTDKDSGVRCRCRTDWLIRGEGMALPVDVKTTIDASPSGFPRHAYSFNYHVQAGHYAPGIEAAFDAEMDGFVFIAVEKDPPYNVAVYKADAAMVALGRTTASALLCDLAKCREADKWPGYPDQIVELELPSWAK